MKRGLKVRAVKRHRQGADPSADLAEGCLVQAPAAPRPSLAALHGDRNRTQRFVDADLPERAHGIAPEREPRADLAEPGRFLEDGRFDAGPPGIQEGPERRRQGPAPLTRGQAQAVGSSHPGVAGKPFFETRGLTFVRRSIILPAWRRTGPSPIR